MRGEFYRRNRIFFHPGDFIVLLASWGGAEAAPTRSEYVFNILRRCFRPIYSIPGSSTNPEFVHSAGLFYHAFYAIIFSLIREEFYLTVTHAVRLLIFGRSVSGHLPDDGRNPLILYSGKGDNWKWQEQFKQCSDEVWV